MNTTEQIWKRVYRLIVVAALLIFCVPASTAQADDDDYWFAFPAQATNHVLSLDITAPGGASGTVSIMAPAINEAFSLLPGETATIPIISTAITAYAGYNSGYGVNVQTDAEITVTAFMSAEYSGDAMRPLPVGELGTEYVVVSSPAGASGTMPSQFLVVPTVDGTVVTITPSDVNDLGLEPHVATVVTLYLGQVYQVQASQPGGDLTGTFISADDPVAVVSGHELGLIPDDASCCASLMTACLPPVDAWGTDYVVGPTMTRFDDVFRVVASSAGTMVNAPGHAGVVLEPGAFLEFTAGQGATVSASAPVLLAQYFTSATVDGVNDADPALMLPVPRDAWASWHQISISAESGVTNYLNLITTTADTASVTLDDAPLPAGAWVFMGEFSLAVMTPAPGTHVVQGSQPISVRAYGFKSWWSYGYHARGGPGEAPPPVEPPENPVITSVNDVPNDQGRQIRLTWASSSLDTLNSPEPIINYALYRRHDPDLKATAPIHAVPVGTPGIEAKDASWDFVGTVPAFGEASYAAIVPSLADSTITDGQYWSFFMVRAATNVPARFFDSQPDSGYSLDNLAPGVPEGFTVAYGGAVSLSWDPSVDEDFRYFKIYRGDEPDFTVDPLQPLHTTIGVDWIDPDGGFGSHYKLAAVDFAGNESSVAMPQSTTGLDEPAAPRLRLDQNTPNPFNPATVISYEVRRDGPIELVVFDLQGRRVRVLADEANGRAGSHTVVWDGRDARGSVVPSGVYIYRLRTGGQQIARRMVLLR